MKPKHLTKVTYKEYKGLEIKKPSQTVQGETLSLAEILNRYARTGEIDTRQGVYLDVEDINDITKYYRQGNDLTDIDDIKEYANELKRRIQIAEEESKNAPYRNPDPNQTDIFEEKKEESSKKSDKKTDGNTTKKQEE